ncbi:MAG: nitrile hydratase subunit alpha [Hyphomicrobiaceae bacterium]|nr:MAG: nitrile hydratase subunit alpha [Hyphomicrobiaceae bacterium]
MAHDHDHGDDHGHDHGAGQGGGHAPRPDPDKPVTEYEVLERALRGLLIDEGVITAEDIHAQIDLMDSKGVALGAKVVARAWTDKTFKEQLLKDCRGTLAGMGIDIGTVAEFRVVENSPRLHNVIVCTLCSCYPKGLLGIPPAWYKSSAYRSRTVADPRGVLREFGVELPDSVEVRVHDSTADLRYIVLPMRPERTERWTEADLAGLVTRDCMIGTGLPRPAKKREAA